MDTDRLQRWKITVELDLADFGNPREWIVKVLTDNLKVGETIEYLDTEFQCNIHRARD